MTFCTEIGADISFRSVDRSVLPMWGHTSFPVLEVAVDFECHQTDDLWICDFVVLAGCFKVDYAERDFTDGTWAGNMAVLPLLPDGARLEIVGCLYQGRRDGNVFLYAG